jgi:hypothetical protein
MTPQPPPEPHTASFVPTPGDTPVAAGQETPAGGSSGTHIFLGVGARPLPEYQLTAKLGQGGFGEVWRATGPGGFDVALKFLRLSESSGETELRALQAIRGIRHPNLLSVFGVWEKDNYLIVAMELADRSLLDRLKETVQQGKPGLPPQELMEYMQDAARGLDFLNEKGIQHRDVKPHNLFLYGRGVKVADFGLAKVLERSLSTASSKMTPAYAAPEFLNGQASRWSDQYGLAISYCQLRGNRLPFTGSVMEILSGHMTRSPDLTMLPEAERPILARALAKEPHQRWPTCRAFVDALTMAQGGNSAATPPRPVLPVALAELEELPEATPARTPPPPPPRLPRAPAVGEPHRTRSMALIAAVVLGLLFIAGLGAGAVLWLAMGRAPEVAQKSVRQEISTYPTPPQLTEKAQETGPAPAPTWPIDSEPRKKPPEIPAKGEPKSSESVTRPTAKESYKPTEPTIIPAVKLGSISGIKLKAGSTYTLRVQVRREHCQGPVTIYLEGLPATIASFPATIRAEEDSATLTLSAAAGAPAASQYVYARAVLGKLESRSWFRVEVEAAPQLTRQTWTLEMLLPAGTDVVIHLDWRAFLQAEMSRRHLWEPLRMAMQSETFEQVLRKLSFDPMTDLSAVTFCLADLKSNSGSPGQDIRGLFILWGKFNTAKVKETLEAATTAEQRRSAGEYTLYEVKGSSGTGAMHCAVLDETMLLVATDQALLSEVCRRAGSQRRALLKLPLVRALGQVNRSRTFWMAMALPDWMREQFRTGGDGSGPFAALTELTLHIAVAEGMQLELEGFATDAAAAEKLKELIDQARPTLATLTQQADDKELAQELHRMVSNMTVTTRGSRLTLSLTCTARLAERIMDWIKKNAGSK